MRNRVKYAVLKYVPNLERNEIINVGIVLHYPNIKKIEMVVINNWKRIQSFDDEANIPFLKKYVKDLEQQLTINICNNYMGVNIDDYMLLDELTKYFANKFIFEIHEINTDEKFSDLLISLRNIYLYYETEKIKRNIVK